MNQKKRSLLLNETSRLFVLTSDMCRRVGVAPRRQRMGPELELVQSFLAEPMFSVPRHCEVAVFQEPRLPSGFPDLVIVMWNRNTIRNWNTSRRNLTTRDVRLAHFLYQSGASTLAEITVGFGKQSLASLERLHEAGMATLARDKWTMKPLRNIFAVQQLIAIEAKVTEWSAGLQQAWVNTWFASESYLLIPRIPRGSGVLEQAKKLGIGVWAGNAQAMEPSCRPKLPASYVSWLFNEWVGRIPTPVSADGERAQH